MVNGSLLWPSGEFLCSERLTGWDTHCRLTAQTVSCTVLGRSFEAAKSSVIFTAPPWPSCIHPTLWVLRAQFTGHMHQSIQHLHQVWKAVDTLMQRFPPVLGRQTLLASLKCMVCLHIQLLMQSTKTIWPCNDRYCYI